MTSAIVPFRRNSEGAPRAWRWTALVVVSGNILFNYLYAQLGVGISDIGEVSATYENLFTPANYTFSIWALIYTAFATWAVVQLIPSQRGVAFHDRVAGPMIAVNLLTALWIGAFSNYEILASTVIMVATLFAGVFLYSQGEKARRVEGLSRYWTAPMSMFLGWISVATLAQFAVGSIDLNWSGEPLSPAAWSMILVAAAGALASFMALRFGDVIFPMMVSWGLFGIAIHDQILHPQVSAVAVAGGAVCAGVSVSTLIALLANVRLENRVTATTDAEWSDYRKSA